jgi:nucleolar protein 58
LILYETPAGYALFKCKKEGKLETVEDVGEHFLSEKSAKKFVRLEAFSKFKDTKDALAATSSLIEGKLPKKLKKFLEKNIISKEV